jgi:hypothetical protein
MKYLAAYLFLFSLCLSTNATNAFAFPEMIREGYANCTACHLSPSGGGVLTPYGRELSKEILSTWSKDGEQAYIYGLAKVEEPWLLGGDIRWLQALVNTSTAETARSILMQADAEFAYNSKSWAVDVSLGRQEMGRGQGRFFSRRYYVMGRFSDQLSLRAGRFDKSFGVNEPDHTTLVRSGLGFAQDTETVNAELAWLDEQWAVNLTYVYGQFVPEWSTARDQGFALNASYYFLESQKVGLGVYQGEDTSRTRWAYGPWAVLSLNKKLFLLSEFFFQNQTTKATDAKATGFVTSHRLGYEAHPGVVAFLTAERADLTPRVANSASDAWGLGVQFFPRPHFEFVGAFKRQMVLDSKQFSNMFYLLAHYYL